MSDSLLIPARFNGPLESGNGGYSAGVAAALVGGPAEVSLRAPVPLDRPLAVVREADGAVRVLDGDTEVMEAHSAAALDIEVPEPVSPDEARRASAAYRGSRDSVFSQCFVCGPAREDAFGVFAGQVDGRQVVATPWTPPAWTGGPDGNVLPEYVWAVLDCPTYFALYMDGELPLSMLARFSARIEAPVAVEEEHVVIGWPIELDGRKHHAGAAVLSADGAVLAVARALLIAPRSG